MCKNISRQDYSTMQLSRKSDQITNFIIDILLFWQFNKSSRKLNDRCFPQIEKEYNFQITSKSLIILSFWSHFSWSYCIQFLCTSTPFLHVSIIMYNGNIIGVREKYIVPPLWDAFIAYLKCKTENKES